MENKKTHSDCCPEFKAELWDNKTQEWNNKKFIKDKVCSFIYMPLNFGKVITRLIKKAENANACSPDYLCLAEHTSKWNMDIYLGITKEIDNAENVSLSGNFFSKVYEGSFKDTGKWMKDFENQLKNSNLSAQKTFMWYTTCPKCAKKYGKNYVVIIAKLE